MRLTRRPLLTRLMLAPMLCLAPALMATAAGFDETLSLQDISFHVAATNDSSLNRLVVTPSGLMSDNLPITTEIDGTVTGAETADLDADGWPEVYVYVNSAGSGSYGSLVGYAVNAGKSISAIYLPPITDDPSAAEGYMGHDEFSVVENRLVRRYPVYLEGDTNSAPSGGSRQIQYRLEPGEAGWALRPDQTADY